MKLRDDLNALTPRLRRYARALTSGHAGGCEKADDLVHATLMRALGSRNLGTQTDLIIRLYATLTQLHRDIAESSEPVRSPVGMKPFPVGKQTNAKPMAFVVRQSKLTTGLMSLPVEDREALLLVALENFEHGEAARILRISRTALLTRLTRARVAMEGQLQARPGFPHGAVSTGPGGSHHQALDRQSLDRQSLDRQVSHLRLVK